MNSNNSENNNLKNISNSKNINKPSFPKIDFDYIKSLVSIKNIIANSTFTVIPWTILLLIIAFIIII
jgi:hypothetical protein